MKKAKYIDRVFEDLLDKDFVNVFRPVFFIQRVLGMLGVNVQHRFVTPPTTLYKIYSCVTFLVNSACIVYTSAYCSTQFDSLSTDIPLKVGMLLNGVVNAGLAWKSIFYNGYSNSQLYVKLQKIDRVLKMKNGKRLNKKLYLRYAFSTLFAAAIFSVWMTLFNTYLMKDFCPCATIAIVISSASFFLILQILTILYFISLRAQYVNEILRKALSQSSIVYSTADKEVTSNDKVSDELVHGICYILDSFSDTMDIFQHAIFFFTFQMLAWQLISAQNLVVSFKIQISVHLVSFLCTLPTSLVCITLMLRLCFVSQSLTTKLETCGELCTALTSSLDEGASRQNAKRITLLVQGKRNAAVFDIFTLNVRLPFLLFGITASYTIVLLQFATL